MNKLMKIFFIFFYFNFLLSENLAPDISFVDLPLTAKSASLGNTFLSDNGSPANLLLNPSNIWFGDRVNSSRNFKNNLFFNGCLSNYSIIKENNSFNVLGSIQYGDKFTLASGYIENSQGDINYYDENANYLGEINHKEFATVIGGAISFSGINFGVSLSQINYFFDGVPNDNSENIYLSNVGLSMINKRLNYQLIMDLYIRLTKYFVYKMA